MDTAILFTGDAAPATISRRARRGELVRLAPGVYTTDTTSAPEQVVAREWARIVGRLLPSAVITDRSALTGGPVDGFLFVAHDRRPRELVLPGLTVLARRGVGPLDGDIPLPGGLFLAGRGRALAEVARPSRARGGRPRRTLDDLELADWVDRLCMVDGETSIAGYRAQAETVAKQVGASAGDVNKLAQVISAALGSQQVATASNALRARQARMPYDQQRIALFGALVEALRASAPQDRPVGGPGADRCKFLPFFEAYFSNFIEGTEFELDEAVAVVFEDRRVPGRADDSHDLVGTYRVVADREEMSRRARDTGEFLELLRSRHATILGGRPEKRPGAFKDAPNRAGATSFVLPGYVAGTLRAGWERLAELDTGFERAVYMMFLVSEVHPFDDGNGRVARVMMNVELDASRQTRIIIPTVFRDDYLGGLRRLSRDGDASVLIKALRFAQDYVSQVPFAALGRAAAVLAATNAFNEPASSDRLRLPDPDLVRGADGR